MSGGWGWCLWAVNIENKEPMSEVSVEQSVERIGGCRPPVLDCLLVIHCPGPSLIV